MALLDIAAEHARRDKLKGLANEDSELKIVLERLSVLELLDRHIDITLYLLPFLSEQPCISVRRYWILSSPVWNASCFATAGRLQSSETSFSNSMGSPLSTF